MIMKFQLESGINQKKIENLVIRFTRLKEKNSQNSTM